MAGSEDKFNQAMKEGHSAAWDQAWEKAVSHYQAALDEFPENPKALNSLGLAYFELQHLEDSLQAYMKASQASPQDPLPLERIAHISERLGKIKTAAQASMEAANINIRNNNAEKAIDNWLRVIQISPENMQAHTNLALVHSKLGHTEPAVKEYLVLASLYQRSGNPGKAEELVETSLKLSPGNPEARQAASLLRNNQSLPVPTRLKGGTGPLRMASIQQLEAPEDANTELDPIADARQKALTRLAELLFEFSDGMNAKVNPIRRGVNAIMRGSGSSSQEISGNALISLHLGQAIDAQTHGDDGQAADELEKALEAGFNDPALYYDLGLLHSQENRLESALRSLGHSVKHPDYALGARLLMGKTLLKMGRLSAASSEYLEALKHADSLVVDPDQADTIRQLYEPLIEAHNQESSPSDQEKICEVIEDLLNKPDWRLQVAKGRAQLPDKGDDSMPLPLAEMLTHIQSSKVIDAMSNVNRLAHSGQLRSAMEEAFYSVQYAPTYLPLHSLISDLLVQEGRVPEAIIKLSAVAHAYSVRGESKQATKMLRGVIRLSPMDFTARSLLIDQLVEQGQAEEALTEYLELADLYYRQADLDTARKTYTIALRLCQQTNVDIDWNVRILMKMADIDMQHLDWRQACRIYEQIRSLLPGDMAIRKSIIDLNIRLGQSNQANAEMENLIAHLDSMGSRSNIIPLLKELQEEYPQQAILRRQLAEELRQVGKIQDAITQLDALGEIYLDLGDTPAAIQVIESIIALAPPNTDQYRLMLNGLRAKQ
jgi:tetratricopeptide (TPR) repeat protein